VHCAPRGDFLLIFSVQRRSAGPEVGRGVPIPPSLPLDSTHPATGQGLHALDDPKEEVEAQKSYRCASRRYRFNAFFASPSIAPQSLRDRSPEGEQAPARNAALSQKAALQMPFPSTAPPVKMRLERSAERDKREILNNNSADYAQSNAERIQNRPTRKLAGYVPPPFLCPQSVVY
jgi:hypothetical protein